MVTYGSTVKHEETGIRGEVVELDPEDMTAQIDPEGAVDGKPWFAIDELTEIN